MKPEIKRNKSRCYCINLRRATHTVTGYYDSILRPSGLTVNQFSLLNNLRKMGVCSVSDLASYVGLDRTTLARSLKPLFELGYIEDISPPGSRNRQMRVAPAGIQSLETGIPLWEQAQNGMKEKIGEENIKLLLELLSLLEKV